MNIGDGMEDIKTPARLFALQNALQYSGRARAESVLGKLLAAKPELKQQMKEVHELVDEVVDEINSLSGEEQMRLLSAMEKAEKPAEPRKKKERHGLPALAGAKQSAVIVRFAPNPDGALHLGNARPALLSDEYAKRYRGTFILRFDDTDPKVKIPERHYYDWVREDLRWLGITVHKEIIASQRLQVYYKYAEELLKKEAAYICTCAAEEWKELCKKSKPCACRKPGADENLRRWQKMISSGYKEGEAVLRIKTNLKHKNPAVRDWPAFRIVDQPRHPFSDAKLWPLFNFASAIDDHLLQVTHIIRGQEHATNEAKQRYLYKALGWKYPHVKILGRLSLEGMVMSKSLIREGIAKGEFKGWDDLKLATLRSLRRRGFQPEALRKLVVEIGTTSSDSVIAVENLAAYNRKFVDSTAKRFFFVAKPVKIILDKVPLAEAKMKLHPEADTGYRKLKCSKEVLVEKSDLEKFKGKDVRLMGFCNVILDEQATVTGTENKPVQKVHWLPAEGSLEAAVLIPGGEIHGYAESNMAELAKENEVVQFERFGFVRIEKLQEGRITTVFGHK